MNKIELIGNLTKDVSAQLTQSGIHVAKFTVAVQRKYSNANGEKVTDFINCIAWRNTAENLAKYCHKGDKIAVVGELQIGSYEKDGVKHSTATVNAEEVEFISTKRNTEATKTADELYETEVDEDEMPF